MITNREIAQAVLNSDELELVSLPNKLVQMDGYTNFGDWLCDAIQQAGFVTYEDFANRCGIRRETLYYYIKHGNSPCFSTFLLILDGLGYKMRFIRNN